MVKAAAMDVIVPTPGGGITAECIALELAMTRFRVGHELTSYEVNECRSVQVKSLACTACLNDVHYVCLNGVDQFITVVENIVRRVDQRSIVRRVLTIV
jgi:hypothetical protein